MGSRQDKKFRKQFKKTLTEVIEGDVGQAAVEQRKKDQTTIIWLSILVALLFFTNAGTILYIMGFFK